MGLAGFLMGQPTVVQSDVGIYLYAVAAHPRANIFAGTALIMILTGRSHALRGRSKKRVN